MLDARSAFAEQAVAEALAALNALDAVSGAAKRRSELYAAR